MNRNIAAGIKTAAIMGDHAANNNSPFTNKFVIASIPMTRTDTVSKETPAIKRGLFFAVFAIIVIIAIAIPTSTRIGTPSDKNQSLPPVSLSMANKKHPVPKSQIITIK